MTRERHRGGRGRRSENKYERLTVSLPPDLLGKLDDLATAKGVSRSGMVAEMVEAYRPETVHTELGESPTPAAQHVDREELLSQIENALIAFDYIADPENGAAWRDWRDSEYNSLMDVGEALRFLQRRLRGFPEPETASDPYEMFFMQGEGPS